MARASLPESSTQKSLEFLKFFGSTWKKPGNQHNIFMTLIQGIYGPAPGRHHSKSVFFSTLLQKAEKIDDLKVFKMYPNFQNGRYNGLKKNQEAKM